CRGPALREPEPAGGEQDEVGRTGSRPAVEQAAALLRRPGRPVVKGGADPAMALCGPGATMDRRRGAAFTLIELLVVMIIIAIIIAITLPALRSIRATTRKSATE